MKKVISFVLVLALVLGSFSMAFAAPVTDVEGDANEVAIKVVNDLGIVTGYTDGTFQADKAVTRAEFATMITRALNIPESALAGYTATTFKDTTGYGWAVKYLAFCNDKGIMLGDGNGNVMPGRTINMNEAVTMVLRAMGLTDNSAMLVGNWPANYVTVAKSIGLYDDVDAVTTVDRGTAAQIIYNALTEAGFEVNADGDTNAAPALIANLADDSDVDVVKYDPDSLIPMAEYIGSYATIYYNADDEIVAIDPTSTFLKGEYDAATNKLDVDGTKYTVAATGDYEVINNGDYTTTASALSDGTTYTLAVEYVGKTIKTIYSSVTWTVSADEMIDDTEAVQEEIADDMELLGQAFVTDNNDEIKAGSYELKGVAKLADIDEDDVVYVYTGAYGIVKIEVGTDTVEGKVTKKYKDADNYDVYVIAGDDYYTTNGVTLAVGDEGTFTLDYAGDIYAWEETGSVMGNYAVMIATDSATSWGETTYSVKYFTAEGTTITPEVDDAISQAAIAIAPDTLVDYALDKDGVLEEVTTGAVTTVTGVVAEDLIDTTKVAKNVVVFVQDGDDYVIGSMSDLKDEVTNLQVIVEENEIVAILADTANTGSTEKTYGIVTAYGADGLDADGDPIKLADIILGTDVKTDVQADVVLTESTTAAGIYEITVDEDGVVTAVSSGALAADVTITTVDAISGNLITASTGNTYKVADDAIVYIYDVDDDEWSVGKLSAVKKLTVCLFETDADVTGYEYVLAY